MECLNSRKRLVCAYSMGAIYRGIFYVNCKSSLGSERCNKLVTSEYRPHDAYELPGKSRGRSSSLVVSKGENLFIRMFISQLTINKNNLKGVLRNGCYDYV